MLETVKSPCISQVNTVPSWWSDGKFVGKKAGVKLSPLRHSTKLQNRACTAVGYTGHPLSGLGNTFGRKHMATTYSLYHPFTCAFCQYIKERGAWAARSLLSVCT